MCVMLAGSAGRCGEGLAQLWVNVLAVRDQSLGSGAVEEVVAVSGVGGEGLGPAPCFGKQQCQKGTRSIPSTSPSTLCMDSPVHYVVLHRSLACFLSQGLVPTGISAAPKHRLPPTG